MRVLLALAALGVAAGCGGAAGPGDRTLTVLAAASLSSTFTELAEEFEAQHEGVEVRLVFESSATLAEAAIDRAPGDVLATADERTMRHAAAERGIAGAAEQFATNVVTLVVPADNPAGIASLEDLDSGQVDYVTCVPTAPCGAAAGALLDSAGIGRHPVSEEVDVKAVLAKVVAGEADAGLVYRTDVTAAGAAVLGIAIPGAEQDPNTYWAAITAGAREDGLASDWLDLLTGPTGFAILADAGFGPLPAP